MSGGRVLGETNNQIKILVAEDDNFQRLALIDILELCNYGGKCSLRIKTNNI